MPDSTPNLRPPAGEGSPQRTPEAEAPALTRACDRVPLKQKLAFGSGQIAGNLHAHFTDYLLNPVFVLTLGVSPALLGVLSGFYRIWDAITDLLMGHLSDHTRSRWGRRRPYIFLGAILCGLWMPVIWLFGRDWPVSSIIAWMIVSQLGLYLFSTIWNIPYQSLLFEMTADTHERTHLVVIRQYLATPVWLVLPWVWWLAERPWFGREGGGPDVLRGVLWLGTAAGLVSLVFGVLPALFCKEPLYAAVAANKARTSLWQNVKLTFANRPFLLLAALTLLFTVGGAANAGLGFFARVYFVCEGDRELASRLTGIEGSLATVIGLACLPLWQWLARHRGKRFTLCFVFGLILFASLSTLLTYDPRLPYLSLISGLLLAPTHGAIWVLIPSMTGDVVDHDELATGERREGAYAAVFSWIYKLAISVSAALSGFLVTWSGFDAGLKETQPENVLWNMRVLLAVVPALFIGVALHLCRRYPLTTSRMLEIRATLEARRGAG